MADRPSDVGADRPTGVLGERPIRLLGACSALGGVLATVSALPSGWYGVPETDAYVFDPATFSPLWIERTVVPALVVLAAGLLVLGAAALVARDRPVAGRLRRWSGYATVGGLCLFELGMIVAVASGPGIMSGQGATGPIVVLVSILLLVAGLGIAVPGLVAMGIGYARTDRPAVGYALLGGPVLSILVTAFLWSGVAGGLDWASWPATVLPVGATFVAVGRDLWGHPDPLSGADGTAGTAAGATAPGGTSSSCGASTSGGAGDESPTGTEPAGGDGSDDGSDDQATDES